MLSNLRLNKKEAELIILYLSFDDKNSFISEYKFEILKILNPIISDKTDFIYFDEKIVNLLKSFFDDEYEGIFFESFAKNVKEFNSLKVKINFLSKRMK